MTRIEELRTPALLLDLDVMEANLARMAGRARALGVQLRPHAKTHKSVEIAERQRTHGITGLTVSTLYEAKVFADHGFSDITWCTICSADWRLIGLPHCGQCGIPTDE